LIEGVVVGLTIVAVQNLGGQGLVGTIRRRDAFLTPSVGDVVREYHANTALQSVITELRYLRTAYGRNAQCSDSNGQLMRHLISNKNLL